MTRLLEIASRLTPAQLAEVEDFAEFLVARRDMVNGKFIRAATPSPPPYVNVDAVAGMCAGMGGDKTDVELVHEATDARVAKYMREG